MLRREVAASMIEHRFFQPATDIAEPDLTSDRDNDFQDNLQKIVE